jgi:Ni,Fe-hydrogenase III large subunit
MEYIPIINNQSIPLASIPELNYDAFLELNTGLLAGHPERHCVSYFGFRSGENIKLICCIADDTTHEICVSSCVVSGNEPMEAFTERALSFERFEREIHENFGIPYLNHPWLKPVRYPFNRADHSQTIANYPFFSMDSDELHEVGVGPIHAGVIEPGHFRFICNGEQILHLEIQLGYQHRGIEELFLKKKQLLQRVTLAESIAGDTVAGHTTAFSQLMESLSGAQLSGEIDFSRTIALELERMAIHTGDMSALCTDVAYQLGSAVFGRLRTPLVNFFQEWGGNRLGKGLIRPGRNRFPFTGELAVRMKEILNKYEPDFEEMCRMLFRLPSALSRFERTGVVSYEDTLSIGAVGMSARMSGLNRDIRSSHPTLLYNTLDHQPVIKRHGDVYSRLQIRRDEIRQSMGYLRKLIQNVPDPGQPPALSSSLKPGMFALSLVEGWRGEICHCAVTDNKGDLLHYKVKDPSFHNWMALALAVRNNEISDFPVCNKSFNLSYCGHDL